MNFIYRLLLAAIFLGSVSVQAAELTPDALAKNTTQEVLALIKQDKDIAGNQEKLHKLIEAKILPHFDFVRMTRLAVGKNWRSATAAQQDLLVKEFRTLLVRTYSNSLATYKNQVIDFRPFKMQPDETDVTVKTQVIQTGSQPIPIDYAMEKTADGWKVYDVTVDGVSLVINYRSSFSSEVRKSGIDGLIKVLVEKNQSATSGSQSTAAKK